LPSEYTHLNLAEAEDLAPRFGLDETLEGRFVREPLALEQSGLSYQRLKPNKRTFGHKHKGQEEVYVVIGGSGRMKVGDDVVELKPLDAVRVAAATVRGFEAGPEGLDLLAFGARFDAESAEAEFVQDWWSD
jgi:mannose-6-phosphate isomerase-like protein (cupin superfamily)